MVRDHEISVFALLNVRFLAGGSIMGLGVSIDVFNKGREERQGVVSSNTMSAFSLRKFLLRLS